MLDFLVHTEQGETYAVTYPCEFERRRLSATESLFFAIRTSLEQ
jgi:hypothetical protein